MKSRRLFEILSLNILCAAGVLSAPSLDAAELKYESVMYAEPALKSPGEVYVFPPQLKPLWLEALDRSEVDLQRQAADAIKSAHTLGMTGLDEAIPSLIKRVEAPETHSLVRLSAARALIALDAKQAVPAFEAQLRLGDLEFAYVAQPALEKWNVAGLRAIWLKQLNAPETPRNIRVLAIRGVARTGEEQATAKLREIATDVSAESALRIEAARALGRLQTTGLEEDARRMAAAKSARSIIERLVAASMLARHPSDAAIVVLNELTSDPEPTVAAAALGSMLELKSTLAIPLAEKLRKHSDAAIRGLSGKILLSAPTPDRLKLAGELLDDVNPKVRSDVRSSLEAAVKDPNLAEAVRDVAVAALANESWRAQEQGALLAGAIDHEATADRLIGLLDSPRPEVFVASAFALRKLSIAQTAERMQQKLEREGQKILARIGGAAPPANGAEPAIDAHILRHAKDQQFAQLMQALGTFKHAPAESVLRVCVKPNAALGYETRSAAIWALGQLHAGKADSPYAAQFSERLNDVDGNKPEDSRVRTMSAVGLGRMKATSGLPVLKRFQNDPSIVGAACVWAIHEITGEDLPQPKPATQAPAAWFLEPLAAPATDAKNASVIDSKPAGN